jgi:hypothetical protein
MKSAKGGRFWSEKGMSGDAISIPKWKGIVLAVLSAAFLAAGFANVQAQTFAAGDTLVTQPSDTGEFNVSDGGDTTQYLVPNVVSTYTVSGTITLDGSAMAGVTVHFLEGLSASSVTTDGTGFYTKTVVSNKIVTVWPESEGYEFDPSSKIWLRVTSNKVQDFTAEIKYYNVSGIVTWGLLPLSGVTVTFSHNGHTVTTNFLGIYSYSVPHGTTTTITPSDPDFGNWNPPTRTLDNVKSPHLFQNFCGEHNPVTISGHVKDEYGNPIRDVSVVFPGGVTAYTDGTGFYSKSIPYCSSTFIEPKMPGYSFTPATVTLCKVKTDLVQDFTGKIKEGTAGGWVYHDENWDAGKNEWELGLGGITMILSDSVGNVLQTTETGPDGWYRFYNLDPGTYFVSIEILDPDLPTGFVCTTHNHPKRVIVGLAEDVDTGNFGFAARNLQLGSIRFFTWHDSNWNLKKDDGEDMVPLVDLTLYRLEGTPPAQSEVLVEALKTDGFGYYEFNNLPVGDYVVRANPNGLDPSGIWVITTPDSIKLHLAAGQVANDVNFGYVHPSESKPAALSDLGNAPDRQISTSVGGKQAVPLEFALHSNYPNPFNPSTTVRYDLPKAQRVTVALYDMMGRVIRVLVDRRQEAGSYEVKLDASALPSGVYLIQLRTEEFSSMRRITLAK